MASIVSAGTTSSTALNMSADTSGVLQLASNNGTVALTVDTSQNVGIGTTSLAARFSVNGGTSTSQIRWNVSNSTYVEEVSTNAAANAYVYKSYDASYHVWKLSSSEAMRITSAGNVAIGVTTANAKLTVTGGGSGPTVYFTQTTAGSYTGIFDSVINGATYYLVSFSAAGTQTGSIASNGTTTTYGVTSDYRLKENVAPMTGALETVAKLKPVTYTWKSNGSDGQGFIAHELQEIVPDCVVGNKDAVDADGKPRYQNIDTSFLVATLTKAIQEQQALITTLQTQVSALQAKVGI
jgi:Chaperone of endosialidase